MQEPSWMQLGARALIRTLGWNPYRDYCRMRDRLWARYKISRFLGQTFSQAKILECSIQFVKFPELMRVSEEILGYKIYEFETQNPKPFIIDLGANIGMSVLFFKKKFPAARILAFEPDPRNFEILSENVRVNQWRDVELHHLAIAGVEEEIDFYSDPGGNASLESGIYSGLLSGAIKQRVKAAPLSKFIKGPVDFLKMDVEGSETLILQELASSGTLGQIKAMAVEYHHHLVPGEDKLASFLNILEEQGFGYKIFSPFRPKEHFQGMLLHAWKK